jgi:pyruvate dehydrogenase E2 component (dihydrolipoamide acetyltransferase)
MAKEFYIPKLGQTVEEVTLIQWLVEDGAKVEEGDEILEVETDKAVFPVPANASGYLHIGPYQEGDAVPVLAVVAVIGKKDEAFSVADVKAGSEAAPEEAAPTVEVAVETVAQPTTTTTGGEKKDGRVFASPRARKLAGEKSIDLSQVTPSGGGGVRVVEQDVLAYLAAIPKATPVARKMASEMAIDLRAVTGTGEGGRITKEDVAQMATATQPAAAPVSAGEAVPEVLERVPLRGVRGVIARRMAESVHTTARVTLVTEVDANEFVALRERLKARVTEKWGFAPGYNDLLAMIVAHALREFPQMNARLSVDGEAIEYLRDVNMGMAVDTERGLIVPVIRNADAKNLRQFGTEFRELVERARAGKSLPDDLSGGTFTITNLGIHRIDAFTPIINLPEAAILGVGRIAPKPVVKDNEIVIRQMWTLSLVFDHRLNDGAPAARFLSYICELIEEPYLLVAI